MKGPEGSLLKAMVLLAPAEHATVNSHVGCGEKGCDEKVAAATKASSTHIMPFSPVQQLGREAMRQSIPWIRHWYQHLACPVVGMNIGI